MAPVILEQGQQVKPGEAATLRAHVTRELKRTVVVKDDDILSAAELRKHSPEVTKAIAEELRTWLESRCFKMIPFKNAQNVMTPRYVATWKWVNGATTTSRSPTARNHGNVVPLASSQGEE